MKKWKNNNQRMAIPVVAHDRTDKLRDKWHEKICKRINPTNCMK